MMRAARRLVAPVLLAGAALAAVMPAKAWTSVAPAANAVTLWGLQSENRNSNYVPVPPDQALLDAFHFSYLTAHPIAYEGQVAGMKAVNPNLLIFAYENAVFAQSWQGTAYPDNWYLRDANGNKVTNPVSGNFLMDPTQPGWIQDRINSCQQLVAQSGYDGCYLDMLGIASLSAGFVSATPLNPSTGQAWTQSDWINATAGLAGHVSSAVAPDIVIGNGISTGSLYYSRTAPTKPILDAMDGGIAEAWIRGSTTPLTKFPTGSAWLDDEQLITAAESAGKPLLAIVKVGIKTATATQLAAWQQFGLATFLLGAQGRSAYLFSPSPTTKRTTWYSMYNLVLGPPTGPMAKVGTKTGPIYERTFAYGLSLVNDNAKPATTRLKGGPYYDVNGQVVPTTPLTLPAYTGLILRNVLAPVTTISSGPATPTTDTSATISFSSDTAGATSTCALDGAAPQPCTSPVSFTGLALGPHLLSVQSTGPAGVAGVATPYAWDINTGSPPVATLTGPPDGSGPTASFTFSSSSPESSFTCSLDGAKPALCTSPFAVTSVSTGVPHTLTVSVTDPYGVGGSPVSWTWTP